MRTSELERHREELTREGFTIIKDVLDAEQIASLRRASEAAVALARAGKWPHLRTLPKQFPPWASQYDPAVGIWGIQHLLHPEMPTAARRKFAKCYFDERVLQIVGGLLRTPAPSEPDRQAGQTESAGETDTVAGEPLILELFNLLIQPERDFALRWHRDDVSFELSPAAEAEALGLVPATEPVPASPLDPPAHQHQHQHQQSGTKLDPDAPLTHVQYNVPLHPDSSLHVVPRSHLRPRTPAETALLRADPDAAALPHTLAVAVQPGSIVFYDNNIVHRGVYAAGTPRATLHGSVGDARREGGRGRARNVLQHGVAAWIAGCRFEGVFGDGGDAERQCARAEAMRANLVRVGQSAGGDVGYSHDD